MRLATCAPVDFLADEQYFGRDSGLICRALRELGHECIAVLAGKHSPEEPEFVIRAAVGELESTEWWRGLGVDAVVFYGWGDPRYLPVARAIRSAGALLLQNLDSAGIESPYACFPDWALGMASLMAGPQPLAGRLRLAARAARDFLPAIHEIKRLRMMDESDVLTAVSPPAARSIRRYAKALGFSSVADKVKVLPHPCLETMARLAEDPPKKNVVVCIGRWNPAAWHQKDPERTVLAIETFLDEHPDWTAKVIGFAAKNLAGRVHKSGAKQRIEWIEYMPRAELREYYAEAKILFCGSRFESFHISSAEALCCGCSVVVARHPLLASTNWFACSESGTLAEQRTARALATALAHEAGAWREGKRDPEHIAGHWSGLLHSRNVAKEALRLLAEAGMNCLASHD